ncbi:hypothetical protein [Pseudomonas sp. NPDC089569]|uniref:hypothetical protein n=1 Tax=Pseudomonas sp. NPDC089569 TaxID=3390722 RepID=UPI003D08D34E
MAALYDFRFTVRRAEFNRGMVTTMYGKSSDVFREECAQLSYADAKARLAALSAAEPRSHQASIAMQYRDDRCPPGFKKATNKINFESQQSAAA